LGFPDFSKFVEPLQQKQLEEQFPQISQIYGKKRKMKTKAAGQSGRCVYIAKTKTLHRNLVLIPIGDWKH
jgi:hypothetical protein